MVRSLDIWMELRVESLQKEETEIDNKDVEVTLLPTEEEISCSEIKAD